jgi:hypothetical protein
LTVDGFELKQRELRVGDMARMYRNSQAPSLLYADHLLHYYYYYHYLRQRPDAGILPKKKKGVSDGKFCVSGVNFTIIQDSGQAHKGFRLTELAGSGRKKDGSRFILRSSTTLNDPFAAGLRQDSGMRW